MLGKRAQQASCNTLAAGTTNISSIDSTPSVYTASLLLDEQRTAIRRSSCPTACLGPLTEQLVGFMSSNGDHIASPGALDRSDSPVLGFWEGDAQRRPVMEYNHGESLVVVVGEQDGACVPLLPADP